MGPFSRWLGRENNGCPADLLTLIMNTRWAKQVRGKTTKLRLETTLLRGPNLLLNGLDGAAALWQSHKNLFAAVQAYARTHVKSSRECQTHANRHVLSCSTNTHSSPVLCSHIWRKLPDDQVDGQSWASWSVITLDVKQVDAILQADQWKHLGGHCGQRTMKNSNHGSRLHWCERIIAHLKCLLWKYCICLCVCGHVGTYRGTLCWNVHRGEPLHASSSQTNVRINRSLQRLAR